MITVREPTADEYAKMARSYRSSSISMAILGCVFTAQAVFDLATRHWSFFGYFAVVFGPALQRR